MAKTKIKVESGTKKLTEMGRREFVTASDYKFVIDDKGVVSFVDADNELIVSVDNGKIFVASDKVKEVIESDLVEDDDVTTPVGEEWDDEYLRRHGAFEKLLAQIETARPVKNLKAELDEL